MLCHEVNKGLNVLKVVKHALSDFCAKVVNTVYVRIAHHGGCLIVRQECFLNILFGILEVEHKGAVLSSGRSVQTGKRLNSSNILQFLVHIHGMKQRFVKAGLIFVRNNKDVVLAGMKSLAKLFVGGDVLAVLVHIHCGLGVRLLGGKILKGNLTGESNHHVCSLSLFGMIFQILLDGEVIAYRIRAAVGHDHCLSLAADLIPAVVKEVGHYHFGFLSDGIAVLLVVFEQCLRGRAFDQFGIVVRHLDELEGFLDSGIVLQHIEDKALLNGLPHGVHMEGAVNNRAVKALLMNAEEFQRLALRSSSKGKEGLILVFALSDHSIDILVGQIHVGFVNAFFLGIVLDGNANVN